MIRNNTTVPRKIWLYYQICLGILLCLTFLLCVYSEFIPTVHLVLGAVLYVLGKLNYARAKPLLNDTQFGLPLVLVMIYCLYEVVILKQDPFVQVTVFLYYFCAVGNAGRAKLDDYWNRVSFLFILALIATTLTLDWISFVWFLIFVLVMVPAIGLGFIYNHETKLKLHGPRRYHDKHLRILFVGGPMLLAVSLILFFLIPRNPLALFKIRQPVSTNTSGYNDGISLDGDGSIQFDATPVARIFSDMPLWIEAYPKFRYLRGSTLDYFDGKAWSNQAQTLDSQGRRQHWMQYQQNQSPTLSMTAILAPSISSTLFYPGHLVRLQGISYRHLEIDEDHNISQKSGLQRRIKYELTVTNNHTTSLSEEQRKRFTQLPNDWQGLEAFQSWAGENFPRAADTPPGQLAEALRQHFLRSFQGSYDNEFNLPDKLISFLTVEQQGHCEYFASATALTLRLNGIPARMVAGYSGGNWNPLSNTLTYNQNHAHTWVEFYEKGRWNSIETTVPTARPPFDTNLANPALQLRDAVAFWMERYLVDYSWSTQKDLFSNLVQPSIFSSETHAEKRGWGDVSVLKIVIWGGLGALVVFWVVRKVRFRRRNRGFTPPRLVEQLKRRMRQNAPELPLNASPYRWLEALKEQWTPAQVRLATTILDAYYAHRFAQQPFPEQELAEEFNRVFQ